MEVKGNKLFGDQHSSKYLL